MLLQTVQQHRLLMYPVLLHPVSQGKRGGHHYRHDLVHLLEKRHLIH